MGRIQSYNNSTVITGGTGYSRLSVTDTSAEGFNALPVETTMVTVRVVADAAHDTARPVAWYRLDGEDASTGGGMPLWDGDVLEVFAEEVTQASFIGIDSTDTNLYCEYAVVS
jgi:hypothetical protein